MGMSFINYYQSHTITVMAVENFSAFYMGNHIDTY